MFACKECGKKFKSMQALGGHVGRAHPRSKAEETSKNNGAEHVEAETPSEATPVQQEPEQPPKPTTEDESGIMENIRRLRRQGYTARQVKDEFGYARSTVDQVYAEVIKPEGKPEEGEEDKDESGQAGLPVTVKGTEIVTPEYIMRTLANGSEDWRLRLEGMMLLRAAQKMNRDDIEMTRMQAEADATRIRPILELMKETRLEQDAAAQRAKESNIEIADRAAYETANQLSQVISQNNARITESINQIRQAMGGKEDNPLAQILNTMQSMQQLMQMFGLAMPGMMPGGSPGGAPAGQTWQPPPITYRKRNQPKGGNEDVRPAAENGEHTPGA